MGTRSLTKVIETYKGEDNRIKKDNIVCMYRQYDGYPSGHGKELSDFLENRRITNGFRMEDMNLKVNNGMGCLGAELISEFKDGIGNIYVQNPNTKRTWEDFEYIIEGSSSHGIKVKVYNWDNKEVFNGNVEEFKKFCDE